ncbi:hypothetical protein J2Z37_001802 [Ammoniphilus resinae]|uniref:Uncharacterized protein n=1 Tax=Ammoniphilus resinae TaxID=861532 RepID=A0ABS4GNJ5_9BACL|nr:hypothetical protein [Ammoniphilus resinae]
MKKNSNQAVSFPLFIIVITLLTIIFITKGLY